MYDQWPASNRQSTGSGGPVYRRLPPQTTFAQNYEVGPAQADQHPNSHHQPQLVPQPQRADSQSSSSDLAMAQLDDIGFAGTSC
jgi:hypothetical protein